MVDIFMILELSIILLGLADVDKASKIWLTIMLGIYLLNKVLDWIIKKLEETDDH